MRYIVFIALFLALTSTYAQQYYADVIITVEKTGSVEIKGISNHPSLIETISENLTSKKGDNWILNLSIDDTFSDFVYEVRFPENTVLNYIKAPNKIGISQKSGYLTVSGIGKQEDFTIIAQYRFEKQPPSKNFIYGLIIFLFLLALSTIIFLLANKKQKITDSINMGSLTDRQKQIFSLIIKSKNGITQSALQKETGLPKASLSRNIEGLIRREIITKEQKGMTNFLCIKKK